MVSNVADKSNKMRAVKCPLDLVKKKKSMKLSWWEQFLGDKVEQVEVRISWLRTVLEIRKRDHENRLFFREVWLLPWFLDCLIQRLLPVLYFSLKTWPLCVLGRLFICQFCLKYSWLSHSLKLNFLLTILLNISLIYLLLLCPKVHSLVDSL